MGKGDRRHRPRNVPDLAPVPKRIIEGNSTRRPRVRVQVETGADLVGLLARARHMGEEIKPETTADGRRNKANCEHNARVLQEMKLTGYETPATAAISLARQGEQRAALLGAWWGLTAAERRYHIVVLGKSADAKCAKVEMQPETMETSAEHPPPDLKSDDERALHAKAVWHQWQFYMRSLPAPQERIIMDSMRGYGKLHEGNRLTARGRRFVEAVEALARLCDTPR